MRVLRRGLRRAIARHRALQLDPTRSYSTSTEQLVAAYLAAMRRLRKRWPQLNPADPRSDQ